MCLLLKPLNNKNKLQIQCLCYMTPSETFRKEVQPMCLLHRTLIDKTQEAADPLCFCFICLRPCRGVRPLSTQGLLARTKPRLRGLSLVPDRAEPPRRTPGAFVVLVSYSSNMGWIHKNCIAVCWSSSPGRCTGQPADPTRGRSPGCLYIPLLHAPWTNEPKRPADVHTPLPKRGIYPL